jgi:hypothetical protein
MIEDFHSRKREIRDTGEYDEDTSDKAQNLRKRRCVIQGEQMVMKVKIVFGLVK